MDSQRASALRIVKFFYWRFHVELLKGKTMNKWLVTITGMAVAGAALAATSVESANIVGYQAFNGYGNFNLTAITFEPINGETFTLADIKVNNAYDCGGDYISVWNGGTKLYEAAYLSAADAAQAAEDQGEEVVEGWYLTSAFDDWEFHAADCKNADVLAKGKGIVFHRGTPSAALVYSGQVQAQSEEFTGFGNFNITANTTAKQITLGELKVNDSYDCGGDYISIWNGGTKLYEAAYLSAADAAQAAEDQGEEVVEGWYLTSAFDDWEFHAADCKNAEVLDPGKGFVFHRGTPGAGLIFPSPLAKSN